MAVITCERFTISAPPGLAGNLVIRLLCWLPGLFLWNDFTVPGAATKQGRRQKPCTTARSPAQCHNRGPTRTCRRPPSVRDSEGRNSKTLPRSHDIIRDYLL